MSIANWAAYPLVVAAAHHVDGPDSIDRTRLWGNSLGHNMCDVPPGCVHSRVVVAAFAEEVGVIIQGGLAKSNSVCARVCVYAS